MKCGQMFWGFFLLTLGALFLFTKYDMIQSSFEFVWNIWPLLFVFWGAMVIFKHSFVRPLVSALFGIFIAVLVFGIIQNTFWGFDFHDGDKGQFTDYYYEDYNPSYKSASLEINSGAGKFMIVNSTDKLIEGKAYGSLAEYDFHSDKTDSSIDVTFDLNKKDGNFFRGRFRNQLDIALNQNPIWDITLNIGASKSNFDLSNFKVKNLDLHTGATSTKIKLGDKYDQTTNVSVDMGAASLTLEVPQNVGCEIQSDMALASKHIEGFSSRGSGHYITDNFENSTKRILIDVKGGVSSLTVRRY
ncbi:MAG: DUF5668 domain-containing protein [Bacteroidetes bacterium]|nr:DUF5668 domain-containing protein [Bacteroidota bacterium]